MMRALDFRPPEILWSGRAILGESPVWDADESALYWLDIKGQALFRTDVREKQTQSWPFAERIGCIVPDGARRFIGAAKSGFLSISLGEPGELPRVETICDPEPELAGNRFNDGKRAPDGSIWAGTMDDAEEKVSGAWWRLAANGTCSRLEGTAYKVTNGPAFDPNGERVYLTDSALQTVFLAETDGGFLKNKRDFLQFRSGDGYPDGMTVTRDGSLWIAFWDGGCVRQFSAGGELLQEIELPVQRPTSVCFSEDEKELYVTSASIGLPKGGLDGCLLSLKVR